MMRRVVYADLETKPWREQLAALLGASFCFCLFVVVVVVVLGTR